MEQDGLFLRSCKKGFQLFASRRNPGEVVLDFGRGYAVLDCLNDVVASLRELCEFSFGRAEGSVLLVAQLVHMARVFSAKFFKQRRLHQA
ncbi:MULTISPECIES: hypothetical protein [unclassified Mesorhizobium]|uniref:hypothetical protein n=1 Tax=unclassified Mesorhizobium TaxID=325217 RepID=UPI00241762DB|nr:MULTISPECIES: hypothetical protein [unclassified Mesorhizobium]MDG4901386.1 hypothetical protein [Mesorhizobium sp. WSM4962]MDG4918874.1 hypothetical protein [Mesorhizobium sp. WSM4989]